MASLLEKKTEQGRGRWAFLRRKNNTNKQKTAIVTSATTKTNKKPSLINHQRVNEKCSNIGLKEELVAADLQSLEDLKINENIILDETEEDNSSSISGHLLNRNNDSALTIHINKLEQEFKLNHNISSIEGKKINLSHFYTQEMINKFKIALHDDYLNYLHIENDQQEDDIKHRLEVKTCIMNNLFELQNTIVRLQAYLPENFIEQKGYPSCIEFVFGIVEKYILEHVLTLTSEKTEDNVVTPKNAAYTITWIETMVDKIHINIPDVEISTVWYKWVEEMWYIYSQKAVHRKIDKVFTKSINLCTDDDVRINNDNKPVTGQPQAIMFAINGQLDVAKEYLPIKYVERVAVICNIGISQFVADQMLLITSSWKNTSTKRFCAFINDACILSNMIDEFNEEFLLQPNNKEELGNTVVRDLLELSILATNYLCERIVSDLREPIPILSSIGNVQWENSENGSAVKKTITTYNDFFTDLQEYIHSFFSNTMTYGIQCPMTISKRLNQDYANLINFFSNEIFQKYNGKGGLYTNSEMMKRLHVIQSISKIMDSTISPMYLKEDICIILCHIDQSSAAVLHIAGLRQEHNNNTTITDVKAIDWLRAIAHAEQMSKMNDNNFDNNETLSKFIITIPDLRNSKFIRNVRVSDKESKNSRISMASQDSVKRLKDIAKTDSQSKIILNNNNGDSQSKLKGFISDVTRAVFQ